MESQSWCPSTISKIIRHSNWPPKRSNICSSFKVNNSSNDTWFNNSSNSNSISNISSNWITKILHLGLRPNIWEELMKAAFTPIRISSSTWVVLANNNNIYSMISSNSSISSTFNISKMSTISNNSIKKIQEYPRINLDLRKMSSMSFKRALPNTNIMRKVQISSSSNRCHT